MSSVDETAELMTVHVPRVQDVVSGRRDLHSRGSRSRAGSFQRHLVGSDRSSFSRSLNRPTISGSLLRAKDTKDRGGKATAAKVHPNKAPVPVDRMSMIHTSADEFWIVKGVPIGSSAVPAAELLASAESSLRCIDWANLTRQLMSTSAGTNSDFDSLSRPVAKGERIDFFLSHSWHDDPGAKYVLVLLVASPRHSLTYAPHARPGTTRSRSFVKRSFCARGESRLSG